MIKEIEGALRKGGYGTAAIEDSRGLFNLAAVSGERRFLIKVVENLDSIRKSTVVELLETSKMLDAEPMLVADREARGPLVDAALYRRYGLPAMTPGAFLRYALLGTPPVAEARKGGLYVPLDGDLIRRMREELGLSLGALSRMLGVSRRTVLKYEEGMGATPEVAERLVEIFGEEVLKGASPRAEEKEGGVPFRTRERVPSILKSIGMRVVYTGRKPLELIAAERRKRIIANVCLKKGLPEKARILREFGAVLREAQALFVRDRMGRDRFIGVPLVDLKDLERIGGGEELWELIEERGQS